MFIVLALSEKDDKRAYKIVLTEIYLLDQIRNPSNGSKCLLFKNLLTRSVNFLPPSRYISSFFSVTIHNLVL